MEHVVERPGEEGGVGARQALDEGGGLAGGAHGVAVGHGGGEGAAHRGGRRAEVGHREGEGHAGVQVERGERPRAAARRPPRPLRSAR